MAIRTGKPTAISKLNTLCQILYLLLVVAAHAAEHIAADHVDQCSARWCSSTTVVSGLDYVITYSRKAIAGEPTEVAACHLTACRVQVPTASAWRIRLRDSSVFASYFGGRNQPVVDALLALPAGGAPTCIWLHGAPGTGKTHLLQALCARRGQARRGRQRTCRSETDRSEPGAVVRLWRVRVRVRR